MQIKTTRSLTTGTEPLTVGDLRDLTDGLNRDERVTITTHPGERGYSPTHTLSITSTTAPEEN